VQRYGPAVQCYAQAVQRTPGCVQDLPRQRQLEAALAVDAAALNEAFVLLVPRVGVAAGGARLGATAADRLGAARRSDIAKSGPVGNVSAAPQPIADTPPCNEEYE
jgi:hypothetical protein